MALSRRRWVELCRYVHRSVRTPGQRVTLDCSLPGARLARDCAVRKWRGEIQATQRPHGGGKILDLSPNLRDRRLKRCRCGPISCRWRPGRPFHEDAHVRMDKLTSRFQQALADAQSIAVGRDNNMLEPAHLFAALLDQQGGSTAPMLAQAGVNMPLLRQRVGEMLDKLPRVSGQEGNINISNELTRLLNVTDKLAQQRGDQFIASELFVLACLDDKGDLGRALKAAGAGKQNLEAAIDKLRGGEKVQSESAEDQRQALEKYTIDMTARAET